MIWHQRCAGASRIYGIAILCLLLVLPPVQSLSVDEVFEVAGGSEKGTCDYVDELDDIFQEARRMSSNALSAIFKIHKRKESSSTTARRSFYAMFGIDTSDYYFDGKELAQDEKESMTYIMSVYQDIKKAEKIKAMKPKLYCDDSYLVFTKNAYNTDTGEKTDRPITDELPGATYGAWWDPNGKQYSRDDKAAEDQVNPCHKPEAFTYHNSIVLCPSLLNNWRKTLMDVKANQDSISEDENIYNTYKAVSGALLHELTHFLRRGEILDQPAYDKNGQEEDPPSSSYGTRSCINLARVSIDMAMGNADTYHIFAMMMYLNEWDWASGLAEPFIQQVED